MLLFRLLAHRPQSFRIFVIRHGWRVGAAAAAAAAVSPGAALAALAAPAAIRVGGQRSLRAKLSLLQTAAAVWAHITPPRAVTAAR
jgi:hypothetical protein